MYKTDSIINQNEAKRSLRPTRDETTTTNPAQPVKQIKAPAKATRSNPRYYCRMSRCGPCCCTYHTARKTDSPADEVNAGCSLNQSQVAFDSGVHCVVVLSKQGGVFNAKVGSWEPRDVRRMGPTACESPGMCVELGPGVRMPAVCVCVVRVRARRVAKPIRIFKHFNI